MNVSKASPWHNYVHKKISGFHKGLQLNVIESREPGRAGCNLEQVMQAAKVIEF
jgi:hypothetical protein